MAAPKKTKPEEAAAPELFHAHVMMAEGRDVPQDWFEIPELGIQVGAGQGSGTLAGVRTVNIFIRKTEAE